MALEEDIFMFHNLKKQQQINNFKALNKFLLD